MAKVRLDDLLVLRGNAPTRDAAQRMIMAGRVKVDAHAGAKAGHLVPKDVMIEVTSGPRFVSRGGSKLLAAFEHFPLTVDGALCIDIGASTGGFTDCLLQCGAAHVISVDVGKGILDWSLRNDARVSVLEGVNARLLKPGDIPDHPSVAVFDVSFISLTSVMPPVTQLLTAEAQLVTLIKPQFEAARKDVEAGGVVRDAGVRDAVVERIKAFGTETLGLHWIGACESPLRGPAGNIEVVAYWRMGKG